MPLIDRELGGDMLFIDIELAELENDAKCAFLSKLTELVKKPFTLNRIGKEKLYRLISHSLAYFVKPVCRLYFCFAKELTNLTDGLAIDGAKLRGGEIAVSFSG